MDYILFVLTGIFVGVNGYSAGPPASACATMIPDPTPQAHNAFPQITPHPYRVFCNTLSYRPGETIKCTLSTNSAPFKGYAIQMLTSAQVPTGQFIPAVGSATTCSGTQLSHTEASNKMSVTFQWTAPNSGQGTLYMTATLVLMKQFYWWRQEMWKLCDEISTTTSTTTTTTTTTTTPSTTTVITTTQSTPAPPLPTFETVDGSTCPVPSLMSLPFEYINIDVNGHLDRMCITDPVSLLSTHLIGPGVQMVNCEIVGFFTDPLDDIQQWSSYVGVSSLGFSTTNPFCTSMAYVKGEDGETLYECEPPTGEVTGLRGYISFKFMNFMGSWPHHCIKLEQVSDSIPKGYCVSIACDP